MFTGLLFPIPTLTPSPVSLLVPDKMEESRRVFLPRPAFVVCACLQAQGLEIYSGRPAQRADNRANQKLLPEESEVERFWEDQGSEEKGHRHVA